MFFQQLSYAQKNLITYLKKYNDNGVPYISVEELAMPKTKAILLDTREIEEYQYKSFKRRSLCWV